MRVSTIGLFVLSSVLAGAVAPLGAQSLADVAKKEADRRKTAKDGGKVYTNKDLGSVPGAPAQPADQTAGDQARPASDKADATAPSDAAKSADAKPADSKAADGKAADAKTTGTEKPAAGAKDQAYWSARMKELRERLQRDQMFAEALQTRINSLTTDFVNRDDPAQRAQIGTDRQNALDELARLKKTIDDDKKAIADAEEEARRSGVPAGWLR
jgi:hypothetical protein